MARSLLVSADMAHSVHPNFQGNHQASHRPEMNKGVVLKINCNGRYTTDAISGAIIKNVARKNEVPLQEFVVHNESPCGSTIGPLLASKLGCLAVDIGAPQLGMHSIRETAGVLDFEYYKRLFLGFMRTNMRDELPQ
jgi:aspartyl aminopeptidase